jgi:predicted MFS family arabinose efflux permease
MFGVGVMSGAWLATRIKTVSDFRWMLMAGYLIQAISIACTLWSPSLAGFALGSLLLGLPFTAMTFFAMQEVRRIKPATASSFMGLLTAIYGIGQIVGPPLVTVLIKALNDPGRGFTLSLQIAAASLLIGALLYGVLIKVWPVQPAAKTLPGSHS